MFDFELRVKAFLQSNGIQRIGIGDGVGDNGYFLKRWGGGQYIPAGIPDMQINIGCVCFEVELKTDTGKASKLQKLKIEQINNCGGYAFILRPKKFEEFRKLILECITIHKEQLISKDR